MTYTHSDTSGQAAPIWGEDAEFNPGPGIARDSAFTVQMKTPSSTRWKETETIYRSDLLADTTRRYTSDHLYVIDSLHVVEPDTTNDIQIVSITTDKENLPKGYKRGRATVMLEDLQGSPVPEATVTGTFTGDFEETVSGPTGDDGSITLRTSDTVKGSVSFDFGVDEITHATLNYNPSMQKGPSSVTPSSLTRKTPETFELHGNYPNPFNPQTTIVFDVPRRATVHLQIFTTLGQKVMTRPAQEMPAGRQTIQLDGSSLTSGLYFYRVTAEMPAQTVVQTDQMMLLK
jgi:hypothetical protein